MFLPQRRVARNMGYSSIFGMREMKAGFSSDKIILSLFLFLLFFFFLTAESMAQQKYGVIIINNSSNSTDNAISKKIEEFSLKIRDKNEKKGSIKEDILIVKLYDYGKSSHVEFIQVVLGVPKNSVPFVGLAYLKPDQSFDKFIPDMKRSNVTDALEGAQWVMEKFKSLLPPDLQSAFAARLTGIGEIKSDPSDAQVFIDDKLVGTSPLSNFILEPGRHSVTIRKEGFSDFVRVLTLGEGDFESIDAKLELAKGKVTLSTTPTGAVVSVNGETQLKNTPLTLELLPGNYTIQVSREGYKPEQLSLDVVSDSNIVKNVKLEANKVKCSLEVKGYYSRIPIRTGPRSSIIKTFTVDPEMLTRELKSLLEKQDLIEIVPFKAKSEVHIFYEARPESPIVCTLKVTDTSSGSTLLEKTGEEDLPISASDEDLVKISLKIFQEKMLPQLNQIMQKIKQK